jgi:hypothetical protein
MERYVGHEVNVSFGRQKYPRTSRHPFYTVHNKLPIKPLTSSQRGQQRRDEGRVLRSYMYMELTQHGDRDRLILSANLPVHHVVAGAGGPRARYGETPPIGVREACRIGTVNLLADRPRRSGQLLRACSSRATPTGRGRQYLLPVPCVGIRNCPGIEHECRLH